MDVVPEAVRLARGRVSTSTATLSAVPIARAVALVDVSGRRGGGRSERSSGWPTCGCCRSTWSAGLGVAVVPDVVPLAAPGAAAVPLRDPGLAWPLSIVTQDRKAASRDARSCIATLAPIQRDNVVGTGRTTLDPPTATVSALPYTTGWTSRLVRRPR